MYTQQQMMDIAEDSRALFMQQNSELLASFDVHEIERTVAAWTQLNEHAKLLEFVQSVGDVTEPELLRGLKFFVRHFETTFVRLYDSGKLKPLHSITTLGNQALVQLRKRVSAPAVVPQAPAPTPVVEVPAPHAPSKWDGLTDSDLSRIRV